MTGPLEGLDPYEGADVIQYALAAPHALLAEMNVFAKTRNITQPETAETIMRRDVYLRLQWGRMMFDQIEGRTP